LAAKNASWLLEVKMLLAARKGLLEEPHLAQVQGRHLKPEWWHQKKVLQRWQAVEVPGEYTLALEEVLEVEVLVPMA
jgi:hypothetical protein